MKFLIKFLIILLFLYLVIFVLFDNDDKETSINYEIDSYNITQKYDKGKYNYIINNNNINYVFNINKKYKKNANKITAVYNYTGNVYTCILPIIDNNILFDFVCTKDNEYYYYYYSIVSQDEVLDNYIKSNNIENYNLEIYSDKSKELEYNNNVIYNQNINNDLYFAISNYKGITLLNNMININNIMVFNNDNYIQKLKIFHDQFYIIADYNAKYYYNKIYKINIINGNIDEINLKKKISFDSIFQGIVDDKLYILDLNDKVQYELNLKNHEINIIGTINKKFKYFNGDLWEELSFSNIKTMSVFKKKFDYFYEKTDNHYDIYEQYNNQKLYMFKTNNIDNIIELDDNIYYIDNGFIKKFNKCNGIRKIFYNSELSFNSDIVFNVVNN